MVHRRIMRTHLYVFEVVFFSEEKIFWQGLRRVAGSRACVKGHLGIGICSNQMVLSDLFKSAANLSEYAHKCILWILMADGKSRF